MVCINCFLNPKHQKNLKISTHNIIGFDKRLKRYKELYIEGIKSLDEITSCSCSENNNFSDFDDEQKALYISHTNGCTNLLKENLFIIEEFFDLLIDTYNLFLKKSYKHAVEQLWTIINMFNLYEIEDTYLRNDKIVFRGRLKKGLEKPEDAHSFFHIPFSYRYKVSNERFSMSGQPMLYFANSIIAVTKELEHDINDISIASFLIRKEVIPKIAIFKNPIYDAMYRNIPAVIGAGSKYEYKGMKNILHYIRTSILYEVITFPKISVDNMNFIEEYVLPQMYTTLMVENGFSGILFPSTKDYMNITGMCPFCTYNQNLALFVNYNEKNDYDEELFSKIPSFVESDLHNSEYTVEDFVNDFKNLSDLNGRTIGTDKLISISRVNMYINEMKKATINGVEYFNTQIGRLELKFFHKFYEYFLNELQNDIKNIMKI